MRPGSSGSAPGPSSASSGTCPSRRRLTASSFHDRVVQVHDHPRHDRGGGQLRRVDRGRGFDAPTAISAAAAPRSRRKRASSSRTALAAAARSSHVGTRPASARKPSTIRPPRRRRLRGSSAPPAPAPPRRTADRSAAPAPAAACWSAAGSPMQNRRSAASKLIAEGGGDDALPHRVEAAPVQLVALADRVGRRVARGERLPQPGRLIRVDAGPADLSRRAARQRRARRRAPVSADRRYAGPRASHPLAGSRSQRRGVGVRRLPVGRRQHHLLLQRLEIPAATRRNASPASRAAPDASAAGPGCRSRRGVATSPRPNSCAQVRLTMTRDVSGCPGAVSQRASPRRFGREALGERAERRRRTRFDTLRRRVVGATGQHERRARRGASRASS